MSGRVARSEEAFDVDVPNGERIALFYFIGQSADTVVATVNGKFICCFFDKGFISTSMVPKNNKCIIC